MDDPAKYLIKATVTANGVVERDDVVGAVYGQTEGLLGDEIEIRSLQEADRIGRIEVDIESAAGRSSGEITIATDLDHVETAVLAAALETIERVGPSRATVEIEGIEDLRAAKRRDIVERARELLAAGFDDVGLAGRDLVTAVRESVTPVEPVEYEGLPAGPGAETAEEIVLVEGRADVLRLLEFGIRNVIGVEGTDVPEPAIALTRERTATAFFDGDRGGDLLLLELAQVGEIDFVAFAPPGRSVEDLNMADIHDALARKVPYEDSERSVEEARHDRHESDAEDGSSTPPMRERIDDVLESSNQAVLLDAEGDEIASGDASQVESILESNGTAGVHTLILDGTVDQRLADLASRCGVDRIVATTRGEFAKRPGDVAILTPPDLGIDTESARVENEA